MLSASPYRDAGQRRRLIELYRHPATDKDALLATLADAAAQIQPLSPPGDGMATEERV